MFNKGRAITANIQITVQKQITIYNSIVRNNVKYGVETWKSNLNLKQNLC